MFNQAKTRNKDMEDNSILEVLTQLESDLKDIKAAKEQIEEAEEFMEEEDSDVMDTAERV